ncbi:MAG: alanine racemase [Thermodesulfobacteriaceae bacterium]|nr:alanine racemase [Thermodesulfobacteriaceae bacterium]
MNLYNLKENLKALKKLLPKETQILAVIKNDAYGHGLLEVARTLSQEGVFGFGLSEPCEAYLLRKAGFIHPILLLSGFEKDWLLDIYSLRITPTVVNLHTLNWLIEFTLKKGITLEFHLKVDTGMHRFGLPLEELDLFLEKLKENPQLKLIGLMTHFSAAEDVEHELTKTQLKSFEKVQSYLEKRGIYPKFIHFANSAGIIFFNEKGNLVRPGISLYGGYPTFKARTYLKLKPVMTLKSKVIEIKKIKRGEYAGYGPFFQAQRDTLLGLVPVGYGDGYFRSLSNKGFASIRGKRVPVVGAISMKVLHLDLTELESPQIGEEVILVGGEREEVPADELAQLAGTISYELFCSLGKTLPKVFKS